MFYLIYVFFFVELDIYERTVLGPFESEVKCLEFKEIVKNNIREINLEIKEISCIKDKTKDASNN